MINGMEKYHKRYFSYHRIYQRQQTRFEKLSENPQRAHRYFGYAVKSVFASLFMAASAGLAYLPFDRLSDDKTLAMMGIILSLLLSFLFGKYSLAYLVLQIRLNGRTFNWIALVFFILCLAPIFYVLFAQMIPLIRHLYNW